MFPFYATDIAGMQLAQIVHGVVAVLFVAAMLGHIYIGTIGMEGAFEAMGEGTVDVNWARAASQSVARGRKAQGAVRRDAAGDARRIEAAIGMVKRPAELPGVLL